MPLFILAFAYADNGQPEDARRIVDQMVSMSRVRYFKPYFVAMGFVAIKEFDEAANWFDHTIDEKNEWMVWFGTEPKLDEFRKTEHYARLLERTGNPISRRKDHEAPTGDRERSIAVLPFKRIGGDSAANDYLSFGLADAVTMRLSNVRQFLVRPTSSVLQFAAEGTDAAEAGKSLGVEFVVDGIIRQIGDKVRVTAQLLEVREGATRWSGNFSEPAADVLALEDSISQQVADNLVPHITGVVRPSIGKRGTNSPEAYDAYLQGRYFWNQFTFESYPRAIAAFEKAVAADPGYALAHVGIADYYSWASIYGVVPAPDSIPRIFDSASRALELEPNLAEAHAAIGLYYSTVQEWEKSEEHYRRAIELAPNYGLGHEWISALLVGTRRFEEGTNEVLLAESLDPLSLRSKVLSAWTIYQTRNYESCIAES